MKQGLKEPWDVTPYAMWPLDLPYSDPSVQAEIKGVAYDPLTNRIFVSQAYGDGDRPVIHVFAIAGA